MYALASSKYEKLLNTKVDTSGSDLGRFLLSRTAGKRKAADQAFFEDSFRRWLVGMVACAINDEVQNHQLMLFHGA